MLRKYLVAMLVALALPVSLLAQGISFHVKDVSVQQAILELQKQSRYSVIVKTNDLDMKAIVSVDANSVEAALNGIFSGQKFGYNVENNTISIFTPITESQPLRIKVSGKVVDSYGQPVIGAGVLLKGTSKGTVTDVDGNYALEVESDAILEYSSMGMSTRTEKVSGRHSIDVTLEYDANELDELVVVAYGSQKRSSLTGAISTVSNKDMLKAPAMSLSNVVGNRVSGITAVQSSGQPGANHAYLSIRGQGSIIYIIDGIRRTAADFNGLDVNEIEAISVLKDASAVAIYGLDANGAFVVTTKRGSSDDIKISYTGSVGISQNAVKQDYLNGPEFAYWYNKALTNVGREPLFTAEQVEKMRAGVDGWGNTDWYDLMWGTGINKHHNISASGGTDKVRFFASLGVLDEKGNLANFGYSRYNIRTNVTASLSEGLTMDMGISGRLEKTSTPGISADPKGFLSVPVQIMHALPFVPVTVMDEMGEEYYTATPNVVQPVSPLGVTQKSGYGHNTTDYVQTNIGLSYDTPFLKGLTLRVQGAFDTADNRIKNVRFPMQVMVVTMPTSNTSTLNYTKTNLTMIGDTEMIQELSSNSSTLTAQASASYANTFGKHNLGFLALAEIRQTDYEGFNATGYGLDFQQLDELSHITNLAAGNKRNPEISGSSSQSKVAGFVARANYNYDEKYFLEATVRYDGSYLFGGMNKRWVTIPGVSAAWRVNNEDWFNVDWIDNLKLRAGVGKTAISAVSPFQWMNTMGIMEHSVIIGGVSQSSIYPSVLGNPNLTWAQCLSYNAGVDASLWNGLLSVEADAFYKYEFDQISGVTGAYPLSMGGYYFSSANVNEIDYKGFDLTLSHRNQIGDFSYSAKVIWSHSFARWLYYAGDSKDTQEWQRLTGKQVGCQLALIAEGLYQSQQEIDDSAVDPSRMPLVGYIRYKDMDGDGVINYRKDQGYFSKSITPSHTGSIDLSAAWKGFDLNMLFSWGLGNEVPISGLYVGFSGSTDYIQATTGYSKAFYQLGNTPKYLVENSWTPENPNAEFPCLELEERSSGDAYCSTFWNRKGDYLRLKTAQIGYTIPSKWLQRMPVQSARLYVEGYNLFTISELTRFNIDPEMPGVNNGYYPQQRTINVGLTVSFK